MHGTAAPALSQEEAFARIRLLRSPRIGPVSYAMLLARFGSAAGTYLKALAWAVRDPVQVVVVGSGEIGRELLAVALRAHVPRLTVRWIEAGDVAAADLPAPLRAMVDATVPRAYVCVGRSCHAPVGEPAALARLLHPERE